MALGGSRVIINLPDVSDSSKHNLLVNRHLPYQHPLESIYRQSDGKDLDTLLREIEQADSSVLYELVKIESDGERVVNLTKFEYNMARDVLFVRLQGIDVYEGSELDYVKTSPTSITFNYNLKKDYEVLVVLAGTISNESFGDDIYNALNQFRQLVDTPSSYYGHGGQYVMVNDAETGLVFGGAKGKHELVKLVFDYELDTDHYVEGWISFVHSGIIKAIRVTPDAGYIGDFRLSIWEKPEGYWMYHSGSIETILWDIMDIPHIDTSNQDSVYIRLDNNGPMSNFHLEIFIET